MQQVIDKKVYDQKLMDDAVKKLAWTPLQENTVADANTLIDKKTGEVLGEALDLGVDHTRYNLYRPQKTHAVRWRYLIL